jgi:hypothetical protein
MAPHAVAHEDATCSGWLAREDPEWAYAWSSFPDPVMAHPESGECLQYMGSAQYPGRGWVHVFRHRQVPGSDQRQYWQVPASVGWQPVRNYPEPLSSNCLLHKGIEPFSFFRRRHV